MQRIPGPRANPTVKPLATMNKKNLHVWEIKIGLMQVVVLIGAVSGSLLCAFLLGYFSGQRVGFEGALASTMANVARMPVAIDQGDNSNIEDFASEVYARLGEDTVSELGSDLNKLGAEAQKKIEDLPELSNIKNIAPSEPIQDSDLAKKLSDQPLSDLDKALDSGKKPLGSLLNESKQEAKEAGLEKLPAAEEPHPLSQEVKIESKKSEQKIDRSEEVAKELLASNQKSANDRKIASAKLVQKKVEPAAQAPVVQAKTQQVAALVDKSKLQAKPIQQLSRGWFAQVAAPKKRADADALVGKLRKSGFRVTIENADVRGEEYFRVLVGPEDNRQMAERLIGQLKREKYLQGDPFVRMVK